MTLESIAERDGRPQTNGAPVLAAGRLRLSVRPADGGRVAALWREDGGRRDILVPMAEGGYEALRWPKAGLYPLAPFSNRIRDARFRFGGHEAGLAAHPDTAPHALHGFSQIRPWTITRQEAAGLTMRYRHAPEAGLDSWPWAFEAVQDIALDPAGLTHDIALRNLSGEPMPAGLGLHPYFAIAPGDRIRFAAGTEWEQDEAGCGLRPRALVGAASRYDRAHDGEGATLYLSDWDGRAEILRRDGPGLTIEAGAPFDHLVLHTPAGGAYLCLEPVSHVADAFNLAAAGQEGTGLRVLAPGETLSGRLRIAVT